MAENENATFELYPNPAKNEIVVNSKTPFTKLSIYNSLGQRVLKRNNYILDNQLDVKYFSIGIYFVTLQDRKMNKQHSLSFMKN